MTVPSEINRAGPYNGNGVTVVFPFGFRVVRDTHVRVILSRSVTDEVDLVLGADYSVSGVGNTEGGFITVNVPPASGHTISILRNIPFIQDTDLENQGPYFAETIEDALDLAVMRDQQLKEEVDRAVKVPAGSDTGTGELSAELADGILRLAKSADEVDTVAAIKDQVIEVAGISDEVVTVASHVDAIKKADGSVVSFYPQSFIGDGVADEFELDRKPSTDADLLVWVGGVRQVPGVDYEMVGEYTLHLNDVPADETAIDILIASLVTFDQVRNEADRADEAAEDARIWAFLATGFHQTDAEMASVSIPAEANLISRYPLAESSGQVAPRNEVTTWVRTTGPTSKPYFVTADDGVWTEAGLRMSRVLSVVQSTIYNAFLDPAFAGVQPFPSLAAFNAAVIPANITRVSVIVGQVPNSSVRTVNFSRQSGAAFTGVKAGWVPDGILAPMHFGDAGSGTTNDTSALDNLFSYAAITGRRSIVFPRATYLYGGLGLFMPGSGWNVVFEEGAKIRRNTNGKMLVLDARNGAVSYCRIENARGFSTVAAGSRDDTHVIEFLADPLTAYGFQSIDIISPSGSGVKSVVHWTKTSGADWDGLPQLQRYYMVNVIDLSGDQNDGSQGNPEHAFLADSGSGNHNNFTGGFYRSSGVSFKMGDGDMAVHDTTISGLHLLGTAGGLEILGPTDPEKYRLNVNINGVQFDAANGAGAFSYKLSNLSLFNVTDITSQQGVDPVLVNCTAPYIIESKRKDVTMTGFLDAGELRENGQRVGPIASGTFIPTVTFSTAGDFAPTYSVQSGRYSRVGNKAFISAAITFSANAFTTAGGVFLINLPGLPFSMDQSVGSRSGLVIGSAARITYASGEMQAVLRVNGVGNLRIQMLRSGNTATDAGVANIPPSTGNISLEFSGWVFIA